MKVIFTSFAKKSFNKNLNYIEDNWNNNIVQDFIFEVERTINIIKENPYCFQDWEFDSEFKKGFINKRISFYYKIYPNEIVVFLFWNNYENPEKLNHNF